MEPSLSLLAILNLLGVGQALLCACALVGTSRGHTRSNRLMAALLLVIAVILTLNILLNTGYLLRLPHLAQLHVPLQFLIGPLVYLYLRALLQKERRLGRLDLLHFVPAILCLAYLLPFYLQSGENKVAYLRAALESYPFEWRVRTALVMTHGGFYLFLCLVLPGLLPRRKSNVSGDAGVRADLFWARVWAASLTLIWTAGVVRFVVDYSVQSNLVVPLLFTVFVNATVYMRLRGAETQAESPPKAALAAAPARKYEKSTLTPERAERYLRRLRELMESEKPYTDGELTLQKLAERLSVSQHHLSQIINERLNQNFTDFVNTYRVAEAKRRLVDPRGSHLSILAIAEHVGFNSKSSFNAVFKKIVGMTPSEWRRSQTAEGGIEQTFKAAGDA